MTRLGPQPCRHPTRHGSMCVGRLRWHGKGWLPGAWPLTPKSAASSRRHSPLRSTADNARSLIHLREWQRPG